MTARLALREVRRRTGHPDQLFGTRVVRVADGPGDGMRVLEVWNAAGLRLEILVDRGFDIHRVEYRGHPVQWTGPPGLRSRFAYEPSGWGWLRNFHGGLLMTCGLEHVLMPIDRAVPEHGRPAGDPVHFGLHGRVANEGATLEGHELVDDDGEPLLRMRGRVVQATIFGEVLWLDRTVEVPLWQPEIRVHDRVENAGWSPTHHELLYHVNLGFPLIDEGTEVRLAGSEGLVVATAPQRGFAEVVSEHAPSTGPDGWTEVAVVPREGTALRLRWRGAELPHFALWYMMGEGTYAIGLEPSTVPRERPRDPDAFLEPGGHVDYALTFRLEDQ